MEKKVKYSKDWKFVQDILHGNADAWNKFVDRFSDLIWKRAWELCREVCRNLSGNYWCVFYAQKIDWSRQHASDRAGCDDGVEIYAFIFDYLYNRPQATGKLKFYDGKSNLETFVAASLYGHLRTDWIRHKRKIRVDQITRPPEIKALPETEQKIFDQMVLQRQASVIARNLNLPLNSVEEIQTKITHLLMANDHLPMILKRAEVALDTELPHKDPMSPRVFQMRDSLGQIWERISGLICELPGNEKILLSMYFDQEAEAGQILATCQEINLTLPVTPRTGNLTIQTIYQSIEMILKKIGKQLQENFAEELASGRDALELNESSRKISVKGLKLLLKEMGLGLGPVQKNPQSEKEDSDVNYL